MGTISADAVAAIIGSLIGATYLNILWEIRKLRVEAHRNANKIVILSSRLDLIRHFLKLPPFEIHELEESR